MAVAAVAVIVVVDLILLGICTPTGTVAKLTAVMMVGVDVMIVVGRVVVVVVVVVGRMMLE